MNKIGFDREKYISLQSQHIAERRDAIGGKLYLEMGGKLFDDHHASRVLPGFTPDNKIVMLEQLKEELEIIIVVNAKDLERQKVRADLGISYEDDVLRLVDVFRERGFLVENVVLTRADSAARMSHEFQERLEKLGLKVALHYTIAGYPADSHMIVSEEGFGRNDFVQTSRNLVVVTAPGPGSGKLATCLSQVYHEHKRGVNAGYAKFETFPIWNLPLDHPVNIAYEAATADLDDVNLIDPFHLAAYGKQAINYNRDVDAFPLLASLLIELTGNSPYKSPTDMGVNMVGMCISDDEVCQEASRQEVIRRYYQALVTEKLNNQSPVQSERIALIMSKLGIEKTDRKVVGAALDLAQRTQAPASALELADGTIITGKTSQLLGCSAAMLLNALKHLAQIDPHINLLSPEAITPIQRLKVEHLGSRNPRLHTDEVLIALSVSAENSQVARKALAQITNLRKCNVHTTTILGTVDESIFRNLGCLVTSEPAFSRKGLFWKR